MHEFSLIHDLMRKIESVARQHGARTVTGVKVQLGALSHISPEHFREHFVEAAARSVAANAKLDIVQLKDEADPRAQDILLESVELESP